MIHTLFDAIGRSIRLAGRTLWSGSARGKVLTLIVIVALLMITTGSIPALGQLFGLALLLGCFIALYSLLIRGR